MFKEDKLFYFLNGLKSFAKQELHRQNIYALESAINDTKRLIDFSIMKKKKKKYSSKKRSTRASM